MAIFLLAHGRTMDTTRYKQKLLDKQRELQDEIARLGEEARNVDPAEVRDYTEQAEIDGQTAGALDSATALTHMLEEVRDALQRIEEGGYEVLAQRVSLPKHEKLWILAKAAVGV